MVLRARSLAAALATASLASWAGACQSPAADVLAIWIDAAIDEDGARAIQIYDGGERRKVELRPTIADSDTGQISLAVAPGGGGFAVNSIKGGTVWIDLARGTRGRIGLGPWGELGGDFAFSRSGRAILRTLPDESEPGVVLLPIATAVTTPLWLRAPETEHEGALGLVRSASDAPIVYWAELGVGNIDYVDGAVVATAYPSEHDRPSGKGLVELGKTRMHIRAIDEEEGFPNRIGRYSPWCSAGFCVTPDGDAAIGIAPTLCQLLRFQWARVGSDGESRPAREIDLPSGCEQFGEPHLLAALDATHVVLDDDDRLYLADLDRGEWTAIPKLGGESEIYMLAANGGRTMNFVSVTGAVIRADGEGLRVVNAERSPCAPGAGGGPMASPDGAWILMTCRGVSDPLLEIDFSGIGTTLRISELGLERFDGLAMKPLGIDDGGNALLYSYDPDDNEEVPRGMFVLEASGKLSRIDELEPTPEPFDSPITYFAAAAR